MGTLGYFNQAAGVAEAGYGLYGEVDRALHGAPNALHFVLGGTTVVEFDACLNESHSTQTQPTSFPTATGVTISDHVLVSPVSMNLTAIVTDSPAKDRPDIKTQALIAGSNYIASKLAGAAGVLSVAAAYGLGVQRSAQKRSLVVLDQLTALCSGYVNGAIGNSSSLFASGVSLRGPTAFTVVTPLREFTDMVLTELRVDRDASTGNALVYSMSLQQMRFASFAYGRVTVAAQPDKAAQKAQLAEAAKKEATRRSEELDAIGGNFKQGVQDSDKAYNGLTLNKGVDYANGVK